MARRVSSVSKRRELFELCLIFAFNLPGRTVTEPSKQTSAIRKKQNVGQRRPHLIGKQYDKLKKKVKNILVNHWKSDNK